MEQTKIAEAQKEQANIEKTEEYQIEQRLRYLDELLDKLHARFAAIHAHDRAMARETRRQRIDHGECPKCGHGI